MGLPLFRLQAGSECDLSIQSVGPLFLGSHFLGRQIPCAGPGCPACVHQVPRSRGFAIAVLTGPNAGRPVLVEASAPEWSRLEGLRAMEGMSFCPGLLVHCSRRRSNSPLRMEPVSNGGEVVESLTSPWRLCAALATLFKLPMPKAAGTVADFCVAARPIVVEQLTGALRASRA